MKSSRALKKAHYHEEEDSEGTWALSYGDMITLLLSFFVIFFTTDFDKQKSEKLNQHLSFTLENTAELPSSAEAAPQKHMSLPELKGVDITTHTVDEMVVVTFGQISFFDSGETRLHTHGSDVLRSFAAKYLPYAGNYRLAIKGFTDRRPVMNLPGLNRKYEDNLELSVLRSLSAMRLLQKAGIPLDRMEIAGAGELSRMSRIFPPAEGLKETELNALSRTIVIVVKPEKESWL